MGKNTMKDPDLQIQGYALIQEDLLLTAKRWTSSFYENNIFFKLCNVSYPHECITF